MSKALEAKDDNALEKLVGERLKAHFAKQKEEQARLAKLRNADPNDLEAQKEIEEMIAKEMVNKNYQTA